MVTPSIPDSSNLSADEKIAMDSLKFLEIMKGVDASRCDVERLIKGLSTVVSGITLIAVNTARRDPEHFAELSEIIKYIGAMLWEWHLRCTPEELHTDMEALGRSIAEIGKGIFPLDDPSHPIHNK